MFSIYRIILSLFSLVQCKFESQIWAVHQYHENIYMYSNDYGVNSNWFISLCKLHSCDIVTEGQNKPINILNALSV